MKLTGIGHGLVKTEQLARQQMAALAERPQHTPSPKVAYIMSRFPKLTETFVLYEMLAVEKQGVQVEVFPLLRAYNSAIHAEGASLWKKALERFSRPQGSTVMHPEAAPLVERAHFQPFLSGRILHAQLYFLRRKPRAYFGALWEVLRGTWGSPNFFWGGLGIFPKCVYFAQRMIAEGIQHAHAHFANHPAVAAFIIHRLTGLPYSFTAHGADLQVDQHMLREKVAEAAFVVAISEHNKEFILLHCGEQYRDKIRVIRCGVDAQVFEPRAEVKRDEGAGRLFTILCIGTLYEVKGHPYLIEACRLLNERRINFECLLVGDGPNRAALFNQATECGLSNRVHFLGQRNRQQIVDLLQNVDVLAVPSVPTASGRREGIPVVLMEAMASGVSVVASAISGIPELVENGKTGLLVPPRDPQAIADSLEYLYKKPTLRKRLGMAGRQRVLSEFDLATNAATLVKQFRVFAQS